jgi:hypothetical protein
MQPVRATAAASATAPPAIRANFVDRVMINLLLIAIDPL